LYSSEISFYNQCSNANQLYGSYPFSSVKKNHLEYMYSIRESIWDVKQPQHNQKISGQILRYLYAQN